MGFLSNFQIRYASGSHILDPNCFSELITDYRIDPFQMWFELRHILINLELK